MNMPPRATTLLIWLLAAVPLSAHPGAHHDIERLTRLLTVSPDQPELLTQRGRCLRIEGRLSESLADLDRAVALTPRNPEAHLNRGLTLAALRRIGEAHREFTICLLLDPTHVASLAARARVARVVVADCLRSPICPLGRRSTPPSPIECGLPGLLQLMCARSHLLFAVDDLNAALAIHPDVELAVRRAHLLESLGRPDEAADGLHDMLAKLSGAVVLRLELVRLETVRGRYTDAVALINEAMSSATNKADWLLRRAEVHAAAGDATAARGDREAALAETDQAVSHRATALHLVQRARAYLALGRRDRAADDVRAALQRSPRYGAAQDLARQLNVR